MFDFLFFKKPWNLGLSQAQKFQSFSYLINGIVRAMRVPKCILNTGPMLLLIIDSGPGQRNRKNNSWHETVGYKLHQPISKIETEINSSLVRLVENRDMEGKYCISIYRKTGKIKKHLRRATGQVMSSTKRVFKSYIILLNLNSTFFLYLLLKY